jgi:Brp/Blh family beta-carotene 15,15'-monooxygenase
MDIPVTNNLGLGVSAAIMLVGGLPHGAFDIALAQAILRLTARAAAVAFIAYVGVAATMIVLWHFAPIFALALFLAFSAVHFGDDWRMLDAGLLRTMSGVSIICVAAFFNSSAVAGPGG